MAKKKKKSELGIVSGLVFAILGALICTMLFTGEARIFGQLIAVAIGPTVGNTDWWKEKPIGLHYTFVASLVFITVTVASRNKILLWVRN